MTSKEKHREKMIFFDLVEDLVKEEESTGDTTKEPKTHQCTKIIIGSIAITLWFFICLGATILFGVLLGG